MGKKISEIVLSDRTIVVCMLDAAREAVDAARKRIKLEPVTRNEAPHLFPEESNSN